MTIRPFDWRDLPALHRYRQQCVYLNTALVLTRGPFLISGALLSTLAPGMGIFTSVSQERGEKNYTLIGQTIHTPGSQCSQLTFLTPDEALELEALQPLLEHLSTQAVERGAFRLLGDVDESTRAFEALRHSGFAIYARQRIWKVVEIPAAASPVTEWRPATDRDLIPVRSLYNNIIPGLVQQVEPFPTEHLNGLIYHLEEDLPAYVDLRYGHRGVWAQPFIHPDMKDVTERLQDMLAALPNRLSRPVYLCVRSYQSWLEPAIESLGAEPSPRQAMMVKHFAIPQKVLRSLTRPAIEGGRPEVSAPVSQAQNGGTVAAHLENQS
jgi:hypothetical protein